MQQIIQETVDESSKSMSDIKRLTEENDRLRIEIHELQSSQVSRFFDDAGRGGCDVMII